MKRYSDLCVFKLSMPTDKPDIRVSGIECIPIFNVTQRVIGIVTHSPLTLALEEVGELVFADVLDDLIDMLYPGRAIRKQVVAIVQYYADDGVRPKIENIVPLTTDMVRMIHEYVLGEDFVA